MGFIERSSDKGEPFYPIPDDQNYALYQKYKELAAKEQKVCFVGRLANYKYFNMDEAILNALELFDRDTKEKEIEIGNDDDSKKDKIKLKSKTYDGNENTTISQS